MGSCCSKSSVKSKKASEIKEGSTVGHETRLNEQHPNNNAVEPFCVTDKDPSSPERAKLTFERNNEAAAAVGGDNAREDAGAGLNLSPSHLDPDEYPDEDELEPHTREDLFPAGQNAAFGIHPGEDKYAGLGMSPSALPPTADFRSIDSTLTSPGEMYARYDPPPPRVFADEDSTVLLTASSAFYTPIEDDSASVVSSMWGGWSNAPHDYNYYRSAPPLAAGVKPLPQVAAALGTPFKRTASGTITVTSVRNNRVMSIGGGSNFGDSIRNEPINEEAFHSCRSTATTAMTIPTRGGGGSVYKSGTPLPPLPLAPLPRAGATPLGSARGGPGFGSLPPRSNTPFGNTGAAAVASGEEYPGEDGASTVSGPPLVFHSCRSNVDASSVASSLPPRLSKSPIGGITHAVVASVKRRPVLMMEGSITASSIASPASSMFQSCVGDDEVSDDDVSVAQQAISEKTSEVSHEPFGSTAKSPRSADGSIQPPQSAVSISILNASQTERGYKRAGSKSSSVPSSAAGAAAITNGTPSKGHEPLDVSGSSARSSSSLNVVSALPSRNQTATRQDRPRKISSTRASDSAPPPKVYVTDSSARPSSRASFSRDSSAAALGSTPKPKAKPKRNATKQPPATALKPAAEPSFERAAAGAAAAVEPGEGEYSMEEPEVMHEGNIEAVIQAVPFARHDYQHGYDSDEEDEAGEATDEEPLQSLDSANEKDEDSMDAEAREFVSMPMETKDDEDKADEPLYEGLASSSESEL